MDIQPRERARALALRLPSSALEIVVSSPSMSVTTHNKLKALSGPSHPLAAVRRFQHLTLKPKCPEQQHAAPVHSVPAAPHQVDGDDNAAIMEVVAPASATRRDILPVDVMAELLDNVNAGLKAGVTPVPVEDCTGGVYYLRSKTRRLCAVFKPADEEAYAALNPKKFQRRSDDRGPHETDVSEDTVVLGMRAGIAAGSAAVREVAAYVLDRDHNAGVPATVMATGAHATFHYAQPRKNQLHAKRGSLQLYVPHKCTADDVGASAFTQRDVHALALLDIRLANQDRHGGNLLVREPTPAKQPFDQHTRDYIAGLDAWDDVTRLTQALPADQQLENEALLTLLVCTELLQCCVLRYDLTAYEVAMFMCRQSTFYQSGCPSVLEQLVAKTFHDDGNQVDGVALAVGSPVWHAATREFVARFRRHLEDHLANAKITKPKRASYASVAPTPALFT
ncbi:TPA: hypothetical protein N0F65_000367 [Lagenidium giganteum]|uniref:PI3K/PI4K catalytic domain-containing protein n=1 Tax=Lagenidium giganteum TaxID=4803 RepID=A0AAV2Z188_9STRA|nr:TPA: hypothetical protein N0F65_000367 [Lagenidium giganteum]